MYRISAVSYFNAAPFVYGLQRGEATRGIELWLDTPNLCARRVMDRQVDIGLVPVAALPLLSDSQVVSRYCIGARGPVRTVAILSHSPWEAVHAIHLDTHSQTSTLLARVMAKHFWQREFQWLPVDLQGGAPTLPPGHALMAIGDKALALLAGYAHRLDLAAEWYAHTGLPFVFAVWVANRPLPIPFIEGFERALELGLGHLPLVAHTMAPSVYSPAAALDYLTHSISYPLTPDKRRGMELFLRLAQGLEVAR